MDGHRRRLGAVTESRLQVDSPSPVEALEAVSPRSIVLQQEPPFGDAVDLPSARHQAVAVVERAAGYVDVGV
ncbi:MAG: hypothetical protein QOK28_3036 [Actinomycetota bacterium]